MTDHIDVQNIDDNFHQPLSTKPYPPRKKQPYDYHYESDVVSGHYSEDSYIDRYTVVNHDSYDKYGPLSNLYDLYILYKKNGELFVDSWHYEQWYNISDDLTYSLSNTAKLDKWRRGNRRFKWGCSCCIQKKT
jgi:hypothetical protein